MLSDVSEDEHLQAECRRNESETKVTKLLHSVLVLVPSFASTYETLLNDEETTIVKREIHFETFKNMIDRFLLLIVRERWVGFAFKRFEFTVR